MRVQQNYYSVEQRQTIDLSGTELKGSILGQTMKEGHPRKEFWYSVEPSLHKVQRLFASQKQQEAEEETVLNGYEKLLNSVLFWRNLIRKECSESS